MIQGHDFGLGWLAPVFILQPDLCFFWHPVLKFKIEFDL
jgi:hypothetical protein